MIPHNVIQGDSLWRIAHRYLGSGTRWPMIFDFHNAHCMRVGRQPRLFPIRDENLIYVGQIVMVPARAKDMPAGDGDRMEGKKQAVPIDLKVEYTIGRDTPPLVYTQHTPDYTITTEVTGKLAVELFSPDKYYQNLELAFGKEPTEIKTKLREAYDPAVCALTGEFKASFDSGQIKIKAPVFAEHDAGLFSIRVQQDGPTHLSGSLNVRPFSGKVKAGGRDYKYDAAIELKAEMEWHPIPRGRQEMQSKVAEPKQMTPEVPGKDLKTGWGRFFHKADEVVTFVGIIIIGAAMAASGAGRCPIGQTTSVTPFMHGIDPNNPRYLKFKDKIDA